MSENMSRKRLGRGLAALIGDIAMPDSSALTEENTQQSRAWNERQNFSEKASAGSIEKTLPIAKILRNEHNPRRFFSETDIADLAQSIREHGVVQPVLVRRSPIQAECFELIAGERRWRAAELAGLTEIPVILRDVDDKTALELAIIENVQRADLNPVEEALGYRQLIEEHGYLQADLAKIIGKSRSHLANMMRLLKLPAEVLALLENGSLSVGHARCLINAENPLQLAQQIVADGLSVRQAEALASPLNKDTAADIADMPEKQENTPPKPEKDATMLALEHNLGEKLGLPVSISFKDKGGDIRIRYKNLDELDAVCRRLERL